MQEVFSAGANPSDRAEASKSVNAQGDETGVLSLRKLGPIASATSERADGHD
jgi:hypothetical protein